MSLLETKLLRAFLLLSWVINVAFLYQWLHGRAYATISTEVVAVLNQTLASMLPAILAQHMKSPPCAAQGQIGDKAHNPSDELLLGKVLKAVEGLDSRMHGATSNVATDAPKVLETRPPSISAGGSTEVPREIAESERRMKELELEEKNMVGGCKDDLQGLLAATRGAMEDCQDNKDKCPSAVLVRRFCPVTCKKCVPTETAAPKKARVIVDAAVGKVFSTSKPLPSKNVFVPPAGEWKMLGKDELSTHLEKFEVSLLIAVVRYDSDYAHSGPISRDGKVRKSAVGDPPHVLLGRTLPQRAGNHASSAMALCQHHQMASTSSSHLHCFFQIGAA